ncbi:MAG: DUF3362 domain-containing protein [Sellimonas intestinalis]
MSADKLKVAPEHIADPVLQMMGKPENAVYRAFTKKYERINEQIGKKQYLVPYLMSSHPGSTLKEAVALAEYLRDLGYMPEQVQDFYPTPSTISTCMYYTGGGSPNDEAGVRTKNHHMKRRCSELSFSTEIPKTKEPVMEALRKTGRGRILIGFGKRLSDPGQDRQRKTGILRKRGSKGRDLPCRKRKRYEIRHKRKNTRE